MSDDPLWFETVLEDGELPTKPRCADMRFHPYAELFPLMDEEALADLAADIREKGLKQPILLLDGQILDGRNRWKACLIAGVDCRTVNYEGDDPLGYVVSLNLHRRQLTPSQRAIIGVELEAHLAQNALRHKAEKSRAQALAQRRDAIGRLGSGTSRVPQISGGSGGAKTDTKASQSAAPEAAKREPRSPQANARTAESARRAAREPAERDPQSPQANARTAESARRAAREIGVNHDYISKAKRLVLDAPELAKLVKAGSVTLQDAILLSKLPQAQRETLLALPPARRDLRQALDHLPAGTPLDPTAKARAKAPTAHARSEGAAADAASDHCAVDPPSRQLWVPNPSLSRLRDCFGEVLSEHIHNSPNGLTSLVACLRELLGQLEKPSDRTSG